ncbi:probable Phytoene desaturase [Ramularia collo-cygni]|uniref:Phytoene desaturase n=1 Tax=Ramularia collo-cygni TaxID=112498 RepID=A0A2D3UZ11_9PEZI|nr:probable Phytoene desaturase [Ramularia collo-cygni]CZT14439.1 probable Phytoene desaturase [Ramularia collo-cygni]
MSKTSNAPPQKKRTAVIIGAGAGGVATAARLARAGFSVTVLEKNNHTGGRCSLLHSPDGEYRFDQGPSLLLLPEMFKRTFRELGTSLEVEGVELRKCEPNYHVWCHDGECVKLSSDLGVMKGEVEKWEGKGGFERYLEWMGEGHRHYELSVEHVLLRNFEGIVAMLRWDFLRNVLRLHPFESIWGRVSRYFRTERLRRVFTFGSMYMGMSPFDAPGTYSLLQYTELAEGIWYPVGGFWRVVEALVGVGERLGVEYRLNTAVKKIVLDATGMRAQGVELESGEMLTADVVVNNSDLVYAYSTLLSTQQSPSYAENLKSRPGSCSSISFYWGLSKQVPELQAHNIFLAECYKESFDSIFKRHLIPDEPSFYVNVPSRVDGSAAPQGKDSVVVLVPVGNLTETEGGGKGGAGVDPTNVQDWPKMISLARKTILATVEARTGVDLGPLIVHEQSNDPHTWKERFNLDKGAILGLSHSFFNVLCFRPSTRARRPALLDPVCKELGVVGRVGESVVDAVRSLGPWGRDVQGLYMVGASAHPGTGVPIVLAGARLVVEQICGDLRVGVPWREGQEVVEKKKGMLDVVDAQKGWLGWIMGWVVMALVPWMLGWVVLLLVGRLL